MFLYLSLKNLQTISVLALDFWFLVLNIRSQIRHLWAQSLNFASIRTTIRSITIILQVLAIKGIFAVINFAVNHYVISVLICQIDERTVFREFHKRLLIAHCRINIWFFFFLQIDFATSKVTSSLKSIKGVWWANFISWITPRIRKVCHLKV